MHYLQGNNDWGFLIRSHGTQKEVAHFSSAERNELSTQNSISSEDTFHQWRQNKDILKRRETERKHCQQTCSERTATGSSSDRREMIPEIVNTWANRIFLSLSSLKCAWFLKVKIITLSDGTSKLCWCNMYELLHKALGEDKRTNMVVKFLHCIWSGKIFILLDCEKFSKYIVIPIENTKKKKNCTKRV